MQRPFTIVAGPCSAESREQVLTTARLLAEGTGTVIFRAGVWKPRTQPGGFEGFGEEALTWLAEVKEQLGLPVATEVATEEHTELALRYGVDYLWIGARTTTNPFLVQQIADVLRGHDVTVLVKNPLSPDVALWQGAIERMIHAVGRDCVWAVHRGFQTGQPTPYRNNPGWAVRNALSQRMPDLPILLDASHMAGQRALVPTLLEQAMPLSYQGWMLECHAAPDKALTDKQQQLTPAELNDCIRLLSSELHVDKGLAAFRAEIDELDETLWSLIARRMEVSDRIGRYKQAMGLPVVQPERYEQLKHDRLAWADQVGISKEAVLAILDAIHSESCRRQN